MKEIRLTRNQVTIVDNEDFDYLNQLKWFARWNEKTKSFYAERAVRMNSRKQRNLPMQCVIMKCPQGMLVDHINGDTLDNRRSNLRIVTHRQNCQNLHIKKTSIYPGVCYNKRDKRWISAIKINGKSIYIGAFKTEREAFETYRNKVHEIGERLLPEWENA